MLPRVLKADLLRFCCQTRTVLHQCEISIVEEAKDDFLIIPTVEGNKKLNILGLHALRCYNNEESYVIHVSSISMGQLFLFFPSQTEGEPFYQRLADIMESKWLQVKDKRSRADPRKAAQNWAMDARDARCQLFSSPPRPAKENTNEKDEEMAPLQDLAPRSAPPQPGAQLP
eukprot:TRINITY_DN13276_c0_g1_i1.p1 TRINITY_DN13276_c0_g1~~TRINITY_DN13276_c0_g1_i1.p1  ORF type:complete len:172 (-),score=21.04 TRINITY_DN13276_c0_g1_i1:374-889(-)